MVLECHPSGTTQQVAANPTTASLTVPVDELVVGQRIHHGIQDVDGVLLLAAGMEISSRFKQLLSTRQIGCVVLHPADASAARASELEIAYGVPSRQLAAKLTTQQLASIEATSFAVENADTAVRDHVVSHGCERYDRHQRVRLAQTFKAARTIVDTAFELLGGGQLDGSMVRTVASSQLGELAADSDNVLSMMAEIGAEAVLSERCLQMALLGMSIGIEMGFNFDDVRTIGTCGLLHDCGMLKVSKQRRDAERIPADSEFLEVKKHPAYSVELLQRVSGIAAVVPLVCYQVHERLDGTGYPQGRRGSQIHVFARVLHVADLYASLRSRVGDRPPLKPYAAMEYLLHHAKQRRVAPSVVQALLHVLSLFPIGSYVSLSDGTLAQVLRRNGDHYSSPIVRRILDSKGMRIDPSHDGSILDLTKSPLKVLRALSTPGRHEIDADRHLLSRSLMR